MIKNRLRNPLIKQNIYKVLFMRCFQIIMLIVRFSCDVITLEVSACHFASGISYDVPGLPLHNLAQGSGL